MLVMHSHRRLASSFAVLLLALFALATATAAPPNVLIILADDLGFSDLGCYGGEIHTPHLNHLAAGGLRFTQAYNTARCWPTRAALLTGFYAQSVCRDALPGKKGGLHSARPPWARLLPEMLQAAGYRTYHSGKWHIDGQPRAVGFDRSLDIGAAAQNDYFTANSVTEDGKGVAQTKDFYATTAIGDHAVRCLKDHAANHADQPFFNYVAFTAPHFPLHAPQQLVQSYRERYRAGWNAVQEARFSQIKKMGLVQSVLPPLEADVGPPYADGKLQKNLGNKEVLFPVPWASLTPEQSEFQATKMAIHAAMVEGMDQQIGLIVTQLEAMNALENTLLIFASDNGASAEIMIRGAGHDSQAPAGGEKTFLCLGPGWSSCANTPLRRHKTWVHEGGIATPLVVHWPKGFTARGDLRQPMVHLMDVTPTVLEVAGIKPFGQQAGQTAPAMQGRSFLATFADNTATVHDDLWWCHEGNRAVRVGDWKLVAANNTAWELYDMAHDRGETTNLADKEPQKVVALSDRWQQLAAECQALSTAPASAPATAPAKPAKAAQHPRPNIIYVMTDDQGYGDIGAHGNRFLQTPRLDRFRAQSVRLLEFHASPTCAPTRAALLTGRHEFHAGVTHTIHERERLALSAITLPQVLCERAGYTTGIFGKWHLGDEDAYQPGQRGFQRVFIHGGGGIGQTFPGSCGDVTGNTYFDPVIRSNGEFVQTKGYCTDVFFQAAIDWIDQCRQKDQPFFCLLTPNAPHGPLHCPPNSDAVYLQRLAAAGSSKPQQRAEIARFYGMIENIDTNMGRLLDKLDEWGLAEKTLVVFTTDNGTATGAAISNDSMRGSKGTPYRGGTRVPSFWRWPGVLPQGVDVPALTAHIDVFPTLCDIAQIQLPPAIGSRVEGRSLLPLLEDAHAAWPERTLVTHVGRWERNQAAHSPWAHCSIRGGGYALINTANKPDAWQLYDSSKDPGETKNIAAQHPAVVAQLASAYDRWWQSVLPALVNENKDGPAENPFKLAHRRQIERQPLEAYAPAQTTSPVAGGPAAPAVSAKQRPSVLVILSDDQRADTIHALGNQQINTPGLDALVAQGSVFNRAYCMGSTQGAVCILSRAMLLTGRSLFRVNEQLSGCDTWPEAFARSGYRTFITGKWHNGKQSLTRCFSSGTHVFLGGMHDQWSVPVVNFSAHGSLQPVAADDRHSCQLFGDAAVGFIQSVGAEPFFAWLAMTAPHDPRQAPRKFRQRFEGHEPPPPANFLPAHPFDNGELEIRDEKLLGWPRTQPAISKELADYYACIEALDAQIVRVIAALQAKGRLENTIILFTSDHGLAIGSHGLLGKQNLYEHSMRAPAIVAGPGIPVGKRSDALCYLFDLMASVGDAAGVPPPAKNEGQSLLPVLRGECPVIRENLLLAYRNSQRAWVGPEWKLIEYPTANKTQLFNVARDPDEIVNVADQPNEAGRVNRLKAERALQQQQAGDPLQVDRRRATGMGKP